MLTEAKVLGGAALLALVPLAAVIEITPTALVTGAAALGIGLLQWLASRQIATHERTQADHETRLRSLEERVTRMEGPRAPRLDT